MTKQAGRGRTRANDPDGLRRRLLDAAAVAFQSQGYHSTAMHDLRREAGVTGGALYHHFPTKKALGLAVIRDRVSQAVQRTWIEPVISASTAADGIQAVFDGVIAELERREAVAGCPLNNLAHELSLQDDEFRAAVHGIFTRWQGAIAEKLRAELGSGTVGGPDPDGFATFVVAACSGAMALAKAGQTTAPLRTCARQIAQMMRQEGMT